MAQKTITVDLGKLIRQLAVIDCDHCGCTKLCYGQKEYPHMNCVECQLEYMRSEEEE